MTDDKTILPSERAEFQQEAEKKAKEYNELQVSLMREDFGRTFQTEHGKRVLAWIMERSGFGKVILSADSSSKIDPMATTFSAMELNNYLAIRRYVGTDILKQVEYGDIKPSGWFDRDENLKRQTSKSKSKTRG